MEHDEQIQRYKILLEMARRFSRAMDINALLNEILDRAQEVMHAGACSVFLPDPETGELILLSTGDAIRSLKRAPRIPAGKGIAGAVYQSKRVLNLKDATTDSRHYSELGQQVGVVTKAMLTIPLLDGDRCLGVMQALNPTDQDYFGEECVEIFLGFGGLVVNALLRLDKQKRELERDRAERELDLAHEIQETFLPPFAITTSFCQVHSDYHPARQVGGDFYFVHRIGEHRLLGGLGDVSGKGIPAALTMARATAVIKTQADKVGDDLGEWVGNLNVQTCRELRAGRFIAMTFLLVDARSGQVQVCAAGENAPVLFEGGTWSVAEVENQLALGILPTFKYKSQTMELHRGQYWLLVTDGITEARDPTGSEYSFERMIDELPKNKTSRRTVEIVVENWKKFSGTAATHDDASLVLLDWRGLAPDSELQFHCCPESLSRGRAFVEEWAKHCGFDDVTCGQIVLACDEAMTNVYRHAYGGDSGSVTIFASCGEHYLRFCIDDEAEPIDAAKVKGRDLSDVKPGGLGTVILERTFDSVTYQPRAVGNRLVLEKKLPS